jgi:hypothetical protein
MCKGEKDGQPTKQQGGYGQLHRVLFCFVFVTFILK